MMLFIGYKNFCFDDKDIYKLKRSSDKDILVVKILVCDKDMYWF